MTSSIISYYKWAWKALLRLWIVLSSFSSCWSTVFIEMEQETHVGDLVTRLMCRTSIDDLGRSRHVQDIDVRPTMGNMMFQWPETNLGNLALGLGGQKHSRIGRISLFVQYIYVTYIYILINDYIYVYFNSLFFFFLKTF